MKTTVFCTCEGRGVESHLCAWNCGYATDCEAYEPPAVWSPAGSARAGDVSVVPRPSILNDMSGSAQIAAWGAEARRLDAIADLARRMSVPRAETPPERGLMARLNEQSAPRLGLRWWFLGGVGVALALTLAALKMGGAI